MVLLTTWAHLANGLDSCLHSESLPQISTNSFVILKLSKQALTLSVFNFSEREKHTAKAISRLLYLKSVDAVNSFEVSFPSPRVLFWSSELTSVRKLAFFAPTSVNVKGLDGWASPKRKHHAPFPSHSSFHSILSAKFTVKKQQWRRRFLPRFLCC